MSALGHKPHDVVALLRRAGRWPAGTIGTVVDRTGSDLLIEVADEQGRAQDFLTLPDDAVAPSSRLVS